jgi:hypothetical protein
MAGLGAAPGVALPNNLCATRLMKNSGKTLFRGFRQKSANAKGAKAQLF